LQLAAIEVTSSSFLIVVEAKRGVESTNPVTQLYGEILAAAWLNAKMTGKCTQRIHGCFTVADDWTFIRAEVAGIDTERPSLTVVSSRELNEKYEAATIVKILKSIVSEHIRDAAGSPILQPAEVPV
jgi:hypothetical protein